MIKVLYLLNHAGKAGTERYVQTLIEKLNNKRIKAYFAYNEEGLLVERLKSIGVETYRIPMKNPFDIRAVIELNKLCRKLGIQLIHTQFLRENYIAMLSRIINPKVRVVYTNHFILANNAVTRLTNRLLTPLESGIIAVCNRGKDMMVSNGISPKKIRVIFNGVDADYWGEDVESTLREELGIDRDSFVLLCASRFAHDKGHRFLINALHELKNMVGSRFKCVLSGDGPLLEESKKQVKDLELSKDVIFTGFRKDIKNLICGCDLYVNSSEHEALSFLIIEVLACGIPVIATDMGGNRDIINEETNCGILVKYNDPKGLAETIVKVMDDKELLRTWGKNAKKAVREKFNLDKVVQETYNLYEESLGK
jgi:glycosyltransferase involved in cell wall biosynthesis